VEVALLAAQLDSDESSWTTVTVIPSVGGADAVY
jgi:hypothetical protein